MAFIAAAAVSADVGNSEDINSAEMLLSEPGLAVLMFSFLLFVRLCLKLELLQFYLHTHTCVHNRNEPYLPLPLQRVVVIFYNAL